MFFFIFVTLVSVTSESEIKISAKLATENSSKKFRLLHSALQFWLVALRGPVDYLATALTPREGKVARFILTNAQETFFHLLSARDTNSCDATAHYIINKLPKDGVKNLTNGRVKLIKVIFKI